jgi:predicted dehydrogenase
VACTVPRGTGPPATPAALIGDLDALSRTRPLLTAVVSGDRAKRREVAQRYRTAAFGYEDYEACLEDVDAVYIALPNHQHAEYTIRAARAGVHVLCEKPLAVTAADCTRMIAACAKHGVKLMTAYRLHFEAINLEVVDLVRKGRIGEPKFFNSSFSMTVRRGDIRTKKAFGGGSLYDIGVYCINAARYLFRSEPKEVMAVSVNSGVKALAEIDESTAAILRFDGDRVASFVTSFNGGSVAEYRIVGTKGDIHVDPAYEYAEGLGYTLTVDGKPRRKTIGRRDQFAPQLIHFSDCILRDRTPEPSGEEGRQDIRIVEALYRSAATGKAVAIPPFRKTRRPTGRQRISRPGLRKPALVKVQSASVD